MGGRELAVGAREPIRVVPLGDCPWEGLPDGLSGWLV